MVKTKGQSVCLNLYLDVRRGKATSPSGCETHPATVAPAGSSWSSRGSNEAAEASDAKGSFRESASVQALT
jgi:hypothetical protein